MKNIKALVKYPLLTIILGQNNIESNINVLSKKKARFHLVFKFG